MGSAKGDALDAHDENLKKDSVEVMSASSGDKNQLNPINEISKLEIAEVAGPENVKSELDEKHLSPSEDRNHFDNPEFTAKSMTSQNDNVPDKVICCLVLLSPSMLSLSLLISSTYYCCRHLLLGRF